MATAHQRLLEAAPTLSVGMVTANLLTLGSEIELLEARAEHLGTVVEIGPGPGGLTRALLASERETARVDRLTPS